MRPRLGTAGTSGEAVIGGAVSVDCVGKSCATDAEGHPSVAVQGAAGVPAGRGRHGGRLLRRVVVAVAGVAALLWLVVPDGARSLAQPVIEMADGWLVARGFGIAQVSVSGLNRASESELRAALGQIERRSVLLFDVAGAARRVARLGWIAQADVSRRLPNALHVSVTEHVPFAIWQSGGRIFLIARDGTIIRQNPGAEFADLPLLSGLAANLAAAEILDALAAYPEIAAQVKSAARIAARRWNLHLDNGLVIKLPEQRPRRALAVLDRLENEFRVLHRDLLAIDLRFVERDQVVLKLTPDAATRRDFLLSGGVRPSRGGADT